MNTAYCISFFIIPFVMCSDYKVGPHFQYFEFGLGCLLLVDMVMNFFTAIDVNEERVYRLKDIFVNYVCGHFIIDAIVTLPGLVTLE